MDGKTLLYNLRQLLQEMSDSTFLDSYSSYMYLWEAAIELAHKTKALRSTQTITTVADQPNYTLNADYLGLYLKDGSKQYYLKYNDGSVNTFIAWHPYEEIIYADQGSDSVSIPSYFTVRDKPSLSSRITGTATSAGASSGGECTLTDTSALFTTTDLIDPGDVVHNTTDGSMGMVLSVTSATAAKTALFNGTGNDWTLADAYVIQPQARLELYFDPPPSTSAHTVTLYYLQRPAPVFSDYGMYRFPSHFMFALVKYAAWLYKYRDREPNYGDAWFKYFQHQAGQFSNQADHMLRRKSFTVNLKAKR